MNRILIYALLMLLFGADVRADEELRVLGAAADKPFQNDLSRQAFQHLDQRRVALGKLKSREECRVWQAKRREIFLRQLGEFPERTPLNAQVMGRLQGDGYHVEKVIFASRPRHHVTASLYLPDTPGPYPGVLVPCGHSHNGKAAGAYQRISILLAKNGMAALCYDPIGQGERYQMLDFKHEHQFFAGMSRRLKVPHPRVQYLCTIEHTAMGLGCTLLGGNIAQYRVWDGMRAIDYLQSRDDIIADKIGCTGNSGGGTMTSYLMALDDRILAAAPTCYLTTFRRLIETKGPQDGEQNIFGQIALGLDEPDYVMMRAPKPTLVCASTRDATFDIAGAWDLFRQSKQFYSRLGFPERVAMNEADVPHGFYLQHREAAARWMHRWLLGQDKVIQEFDPATLPDPLTDEYLRSVNEGDWTQEQLYCTPEGQTLLMKDEMSVFDINAQSEQRRRSDRSAAWEELSVPERRDLVRRTIGAASPSKPTDKEAPIKTVGTVPREGYTIEKLILTRESDIQLPGLAFIPAKPNGRFCLYLHGVSMQTDAAPGGAIEALVKDGTLVVAAELRGIGETGADKNDWSRGRFGRDIQGYFMAYLIGQSYVGLRTDDVAAWTRSLSQYRAPNKQPRQIDLIAIGEAAIPALHAAAINPEQYATIRLQHMIRSWSEVVASPDSLNQAVNTVHGALLHYDLPDLIELAGADRTRLQHPVDVLGEVVGDPAE